MFQVNRLGQTFFAEVVGLDLAQSLDEAAFARVKQAHLEHGVLVFRDQRLTPGQHIAFSARFDKHPDGRPVGIADAGRYWHTDMSYMTRAAGRASPRRTAYARRRRRKNRTAIRRSSIR
jgi:taurine dioxygenase